MHVSAMSKTFVSDPRQVVTSGQVVKVKVMAVDEQRKRISLSLRLDDEPGAPAGRPSGQRQGRPEQRDAQKGQPLQGGQRQDLQSFMVYSNLALNLPDLKSWSPILPWILSGEAKR